MVARRRVAHSALRQFQLNCASYRQGCTTTTVYGEQVPWAESRAQWKETRRSIEAVDEVNFSVGTRLVLGINPNPRLTRQNFS